ncbi:MAG: SRPBCC domain-containing protein [Bacteroidota bacterium]
MRIIDRTTISRPALRVWPYIARPEYYQRWNSKIHAMAAEGEFQPGQPFTTHYIWNSRHLQCLTVVTEIREGKVLELKHSDFVGKEVDPGMTVVERITLREGASGNTVVTKVVTVTGHRLLWLLLPVIWFVSRFGKPVGPDPLKLLCESDGGE